MIVKILSSSAKFSGVVYNTNKIDRNKGDLMKVANFGALQGLGRLRPQDYINYLQMLATQNKRIKKPQFHAALSAKGKSYSGKELTEIAVAWLEKMGYGAQPYLIIYHRDTDNNHVHAVSVRVDKNGKKINSAYEKLRAIGNLRDVLGIDRALTYSFSTRAQFFMVMENLGLPGKEVSEKIIREKISKYKKPVERIRDLRGLFQQIKQRPDFRQILSSQYQIELIFHSSEGKPVYGYSIIDHAGKLVLKGSEVLQLKEILAENTTLVSSDTPENPITLYDQETGFFVQHQNEAYEPTMSTNIKPIWIADDVDDQQIHGMRRRRQKKARTNTR